MPTLYKCPECSRTYDTLTFDDKCEKCVVKLEAVGVAEERSQTTETSSVPRLEGLCVLVCDASYSMSNFAFPVERPGLTKLRLVVDAIENAVDAMKNLSMSSNAYIAIVPFGSRASLLRDRQKNPFVKSVQNILAEFGEPAAREKALAEGVNWESLSDQEKGRRLKEASLAEYLHDQFEQGCGNIDRDGTNITEALQLAHEISAAAEKGDLTKWGFQGKVSLLSHRVTTFDDKNQKVELDVPNVRVMIYSDGVHNRGNLANPFKEMKPVSVLMTAFIGRPDADDEALKGHNDMKLMANICPIHRDTGYFLIHTQARGALLRKLFRMATTYSGFCTQCAI